MGYLCKLADDPHLWCALQIHNTPSEVDAKLGFDHDDWEWVHAEIIDREPPNYHELNPEASLH